MAHIDMKNHFFLLRRLTLAVILLGIFTPLLAQQNQEIRRTNSVFAFPEFRKAKILQPFGRSVTAEANILLRNSTLCYIDSGKVMQAYVRNILGVEFDDSTRYLKVDSVMGRVLAEKDWKSLVVVTSIDKRRYDAETTGGDNLPYFEISDLNVFLEINGDQRDDARGYPLKDEYYFIIDGMPVRANEKNIKKYVRPEMKKAFNNLMHDKFWSWKDAASLMELFAFF